MKSTASIRNKPIQSVKLEERRTSESMAAESLIFEDELDLDLAFHLQMEEAMAASLALQPSTSQSPSSSTSSQPFTFNGKNSVDDFRFLVSNANSSSICGIDVDFVDLQKSSKERDNREESKVEITKPEGDLDHRFDDEIDAILNMFHVEWEDYDDVSESPNGADVSAIGIGIETSRREFYNTECFRLYFKGLVSEERVGDVKVIVAVAAAAVCDSSGNLLMEVKKPLEAVQGNEVLSSEIVELMALIEGLEAALAFPLENVSFFCDNDMLYQYITGRLKPQLDKIASLVDKVALLRCGFTFCEPCFVESKNVKFAIKLAEDSIVSQLETGKGKILLENCRICFEDTDLGQMFTVNDCLHRYCFSCMKQHVEVKFLGGSEAKCPHEGCESTVTVESCHDLLPLEVIEIIRQRLKESSIPVSEKVYCPDPRCSLLMSKTEVLEYTKVQGNAEGSEARKCMKCRALFCINCKISWHYRMNCDEYSTFSSDTRTEDAQLKSLATEKLWRPCSRCSHLVELAEGCYHITCRCGYEFCYTCGSEWKNKKSTCSCPIWDEHHIIRDE